MVNFIYQETGCMFCLRQIRKCEIIMGFVIPVTFAKPTMLHEKALSHLPTITKLKILGKVQ